MQENILIKLNNFKEQSKRVRLPNFKLYNKAMIIKIARF